MKILLAIPVAAAIAVSAAPQSREANPRERTVYVRALDSKGAPVKDLGVADFAIREDGTAREVLKVGPAATPLQLMILVDDSQAADKAIPYYRDGLTKFVRKLGDKAEIGLITVGERPTSIAEHTTSTVALEKAITRIFARPGSGSYLLDGLIDVCKGFQKREVSNGQILVLSMEATEFSNLHSQPVLEQLYGCGATLHVIALGNPPTSDDDEARNRNQVIADGTQNTGGRRDQLIALMGIPDKLSQVADDLVAQYAVTYMRPEMLIPPTKIQVTTTRPGVTVRARTRLPAK